MIRKLQKRIRWRIAVLVNRLYKTACWARLVLWAVYPEHHPFTEIWHLRDSAGDWEDCQKVPYCGKCFPELEVE